MTSQHATQPTAVHIDDLATPRLTTIQRMAIRAAEEQQRTVELSTETVLRAARAQTGLTHFGAGDFEGRLSLWLQCAREDQGLNALGRMSIFADCVRYAANRLKLEDLLLRHPQILHEAIQQPLIVAGLPRSGTTHLVNMLAADQRLSAVPYWEMREPVAPGNEPTPTDARDDPRYQRAEQAWQQLDATLPLLKNMHPMDPAHIHEELELENLDFSSYNLEWLARVPQWRDYYLAHDQTPHYCYLRKVLQAIQWQRRQHSDQPVRWVLKSPQHLEQLVPLRNTFADATFVLTHREPAAVIASIATMLAYGDRLRRTDTDPAGVANYWIERVDTLLRACVRDRAQLPAEQSIDIRFGDYMQDEMATLADIYRCAGLPFDGPAQQQLQDYQAANPRNKYGEIRYALEADFGIATESLNDRFAFYRERFNL